MLQRDIENLSVLESQPKHQIHCLSPNSDHQVSPNAQDTGSGSLERENYEDSTPLVDNKSPRVRLVCFKETLRIYLYQRVNLNVKFILYLIILIIRLVEMLRIVGVVL